MSITQLPSPPLVTDTTAVFNAKAFALAAALQQLVSEINAEIPAIDGAYPASLISIGSANYKGDWSTLTGALNIPASCSYGSRIWLLTSNLANVTTAQPGVSSSWLDITPTKGAMKNRIINGGMQIDQRNDGAAVTPTASAYTIDRWLAAVTQASKLTFQQVADAPAGMKTSLKVTVASQFSPGAADVFSVSQGIEGNNIIDLQFGSAGALSITTSFQVKSSITGTFACNVQNGSVNRSYVATYSIPVANVWTPIVLTIAGDQTGTWATDTSAGMYLTFDLGSGSNYNTTAGAWNAGNLKRTSGCVSFVNQTAGATWQLAQVQLEAGSIATSWDVRDYGRELMMCQRYYEKSYDTATAPGTAATYAGSVFWTMPAFGSFTYQGARFAVPKRAAPTVTMYAPGTGNSGNVTNMSAGDQAGTAAYISASGFSLATASGVSNIYSGHFVAVSEI